MSGAKEYFIEFERQHYGPYDLISIIRKIRNGQITPHTALIAAGEEQGIAAKDIPLFSEVFAEMANEAQEDGVEQRPTLGFMALMRNAVETLTLNLVMSVQTGFFLLLVIIGGFLLYTLSESIPMTAVLTSIIGYFFFSLYLMTVLRKTRMQLVSGTFFSLVIKRSGLQLLIISSLIGLPVFALPVIISEFIGPVALALILLPGSFIFLALFYAPILVADRGIGAMPALKGSIAALGSLGRDNIITLYLILILNFIGAAFLLVPLLLSLPLTMAALCEVYDDYLNQFKIA